MVEQEQVQTQAVTEEEKKKLLDWFGQLDTGTLKVVFETLSMFVRAVEGKPIEAEDVITRLTNVKELLERSRFPTYPLLAKQVYLRLIAKYAPEAQACKDWADLEAEALIEYKGQGREEYVESLKAAANVGMEQEFYMGEKRLAEVPQVKRHFWQRKPKQEESEFIHQ